MAEPAFARMTLDDFLAWEDGTDTRYELIGGFVVAMAPASEGHGALAARMAARLEAALAARRPCRTLAEAGVLHPERADTYFVADLAVTCAPSDRRRQFVQDPILIVEVLSPRTEVHDRGLKLPAYREIGTVQEILLVGSDRRYVELHRRAGAQWITEILRGEADTIGLTSVGTEIPLAELYDGIAFDDVLAS
ncbi:MAG TPA: Uma2 family endonuclease [Stellaceae bacterium]|nr:Uma2 family endonuclease [Stellaceae bacterium]